MADSPRSPLAERLLRRATDPLGVVDVRPAVSRYERATAWPRHHLAAVERPVARIQLEGAPEQRAPMTLAAAAMPSLRDVLETTAGNTSSAGWRAPSAAPVSVMRSVRQGSESIARAGNHGEDAEASRSASSRTSAAASGTSPTMVTGPAMRAVSRTRLDRRAESSAPSSAQVSTGAGEQRGSVVGSNNEGMRVHELPVAPPAHVEMTPVAPHRTGGLSSIAEAMRDVPPPSSRELATAPALSPAITAAQPLVQRRTADRGAMPVATLPNAGQTMSNTAVARQRAASTTQAAAVPEMSYRASRSAVARSLAPWGTATGQPPVSPGSVGPIVARTLAPAGDSASSQAAPEPMVLRSAMTQTDMIRSERPLAGAAAATGAPRPGVPSSVQLVWRRGASAESSTVLARSLASSTSPHSTNSASVAPTQQGAAIGGNSTIPSAVASPQPAAEKGSPINVDQLAQEIMRRVFEQIAIQRERLGEPWR